MSDDHALTSGPASVARRAAAVTLVLAVFLALLGLGTWQMQRLAWKEALIGTIETRRTSLPETLAEVEQRFAATGDVDYVPVRLTGRFLNDRESHFFATWEGASGFFVYTPLELGDGRPVLVNRGFVPYDRKDPATRRQGQVGGEVTITGLARNPLDGKPSVMIPDNDPAGNIFYWKDRAALARHAGLDEARLLPFFVDAAPSPAPGGLPIGGVTIVDLPNSHLQYAVTWYGLALALVGICFAWARRQRADRTARP